MSDNTASDVTCQSSERAAHEFETLLNPLLKAAWKMALSLTHHREDAEDLVQNAALRAFAAFGRFERGTNFKAWFFRVLLNLFLHQRRDAGRTPQTTALDDVPEWSLYAQMRQAGLHRRDYDPAALLLSKLDGEDMHRAFERLPAEFRIVSLLYFVEEFSYQEIADILDCPIGTVRSRLHRGRKLLQQELWQLAQEHGIAAK